MAGAIAIVTGGASGIGAALAGRFAAEGARVVLVVDRDGAGAAAVADRIAAQAVTEVHAVTVDVSDAGAVADLVETVVRAHGRIDLFCSNAGVADGAGIDAAAADWARALEVNLMAHVYAAQAVLPVMTRQGRGYLLQTCSAAGLLTAPGDAPYTVSKHAAVALAEWLAIEYAPAGIKVSALCPMGVDTPLLMAPLAAGHPSATAVAQSGPVISPEDVADAVIQGLRDERFLILPHPEVARFWARKAADPDRWLQAMAAARTAWTEQN